MDSRGGHARNITVNSEILCTVQHILEDLMVVRFTDSNNKSFQGVLLDSTKRCLTNHLALFLFILTGRNIPFGVNPPVGFTQKLEEDNPRDYDSVCASRHTYFLQHNQLDRTPLVIPSRKNGKRVRLRARQVLCRKCSAVCNEKGQNLKEISQQGSKPTLRSSKGGVKLEKPQAKRVVGNLNETRSSTPTLTKRTKGKPSYFGGKKRKRGPVTKSLKDCDIDIEPTISHTDDLDDKSKRLAENDCLVPKLKRLAPSEIERFSDVSELEGTHDTPTSSRPSSKVTSTTCSQVSESYLQPLKMKFSNLKQNSSSRQQYSIVQPETSSADNRRICDESFNRPVEMRLRKSPGEKEKPTPVLKISIGKKSQVVTVSAREVNDVDDKKSEDVENVMPPTSSTKSRSLDAGLSRAAKKALKRARKEAAKRSAGILSPGRPYLGPKSPKAARRMGGFSPNVGALMSPDSSSVFSSPAAASPAYTLQCPSSQKIIFRKVKKKKKKCKERKNSDPTETPTATSVDIDILEEENLSGEDSTEDLLVSPAPANLCVGDVVWARSDCHLWWPGKIVNLMLLDNTSRAQVSWYSYSSTTLLPLNSLKPFSLHAYEVNTGINILLLMLIPC